MLLDQGEVLLIWKKIYKVKLFGMVNEIHKVLKLSMVKHYYVLYTGE